MKEMKLMFPWFLFLEKPLHVDVAGGWTIQYAKQNLNRNIPDTNAIPWSGCMHAMPTSLASDQLLLNH